MPDYEITFLHKGRVRAAVISGDDHRDAYEAFQSMSSNGVIGDEIVEVVHAPDIDLEKAREFWGKGK